MEWPLYSHARNPSFFTVVLGQLDQTLPLFTISPYSFAGFCDHLSMYTEAIDVSPKAMHTRDLKIWHRT